MDCWNCGKSLSIEKISFRSICDSCGEYLHCCYNCQNFQEGLSNNCKIPGTEYVVDRAKNNFCDEFLALGKSIQKKSKNTGKFNDLFK
jgi:hypothetical protein